jgi:hypothetical protein
MGGILDKLLAFLRQPEVIAAIATVIFFLIREFVPELQDYVTVEFLIGLLMLLLGVGAARYVRAARQRGNQ